MPVIYSDGAELRVLCMPSYTCYQWNVQGASRLKGLCAPGNLYVHENPRNIGPSACLLLEAFVEMGSLHVRNLGRRKSFGSR